MPQHTREHLQTLVAMRQGGATIRSIAAATGISKSQVSRLLRGVEPLRGPLAKFPERPQWRLELVPVPGGGFYAVAKPPTPTAESNR